MEGKTAFAKRYPKVDLPAGRTVTPLPRFTPRVTKRGYYAVEYRVTE
jgi:hypothetical protein